MRSYKKKRNRSLRARARRAIQGLCLVAIIGGIIWLLIRNWGSFTQFIGSLPPQLLAVGLVYGVPCILFIVYAWIGIYQEMQSPPIDGDYDDSGPLNGGGGWPGSGGSWHGGMHSGHGGH